MSPFSIYEKVMSIYEDNLYDSNQIVIKGKELVSIRAPEKVCPIINVNCTGMNLEEFVDVVNKLLQKANKIANDNPDMSKSKIETTIPCTNGAEYIVDDVEFSEDDKILYIKYDSWNTIWC